jgi:hypothetical protein
MATPAVLVEAGIFTSQDIEDMTSATARIAIVLMGARLVVENLPEFFDARFLHVEGR